MEYQIMLEAGNSILLDGCREMKKDVLQRMVKGDLTMASGFTEIQSRYYPLTLNLTSGSVKDINKKEVNDAYSKKKVKVWSMVKVRL